MNLKKIQNKIEASLPEITKMAEDATEVASQHALGLITRIIFNDGLDASGNKIGTYDDVRKQKFLTERAALAGSFTKKQEKKLEKSDEDFTYKRLRELKGLQTDFVDLQFNGDLFRSVDKVVKENKGVIAITNKEEAKISAYHEKKYKKDIFVGSDKERMESLETARTYAMDKLRSIFKSWGQ